MFTNFDISEFLKLGGKVPDTVPVHVVEKLVKKHMPNLQHARDIVRVPIHVTSGYRPVEWEHSKGRSGESQHTFQDDGAVDVSLFRNTGKWTEFFFAIRPLYSRIAWYPIQNFMHLDFHANSGLFISRHGTWQRVNQNEFFESL